MRLSGSQPLFTNLRAVIAKVRQYPVTAKDLVELAKAHGADESVINFYRAFPPDQIFPDREDLLARSEQVGLLNSDDQPAEIFHAPEED